MSSQNKQKRSTRRRRKRVGGVGIAAKMSSMRKESKGIPLISRPNVGVSGYRAPTVMQPAIMKGDYAPALTIDRMGRDGALLTGCLPIGYISFDAAFTADPFHSIVLGSNFSGITLNPLSYFPTGTRDLQESNSYTRFRFRKFRIIYQGQAGTGISGGFFSAYYADGAASGGDFGPNTTLAVPGVKSVALWQPDYAMDYSNQLDTKSWFYVDEDEGISSDAGLRQSYQGVWLTDFFPASYTANTFGVVYLDYQLELDSPRSVRNLALSSGEIRRDPRERVLRRLISLRDSRKRHREVAMSDLAPLLHEVEEARSRSSDRKTKLNR